MKVANVGEAMRKEVARERKAGPTVLVRAIAIGFYGYPLADVIKPGTEFKMRVADLERDTAAKKLKPGDTYYNGVAARFVKVDGKMLVLPMWCEDPKAATSLLTPPEAEDESDDTFSSAGDDVL